MNSIKNLFTLLSNYKKEILILKIIVLIIINMWLLFIFWKIIALDGLNITNNNIALTKMQTILGPLLQILGLDVLSPNTLKMILITSIIVTSNLAVLYFSQMMAFIFLGIIARYSYKAYYNYINKDTLNYYGFEKLPIELSLQEKNEIFKEFLIEKAIKDENIIGYLSHKMNEFSCINKTELILSLNNNYIEYNQAVLSKLLLQQKEQILTIKNTNENWLNSLDFNTLVKIGFVVIIVGVGLWFGYSYYNNNAIKAAGDIGKKALDGAEKSSNIALDHANENAKELLEHSIKTSTLVHNELMDTNKSVSELAENVKKLNDVVNDQHKKIIEISTEKNVDTQEFIKKGSEIQAECVKISSQALKENVKTIETSKILTENVTNINGVLETLNNKVTKTEDMVSNLNKLFIGGTEVETLVGTTPINVPSLLNQVNELSAGVNGNTASIRALLNFIGLDVDLTIIGEEMLNRIREATGRENVYQAVLNREDLSNIEPVSNDIVTNIEQNER